ncbi:MAG: DUF982 domain-containing protein [Rhizobium sp.]|jgi:hypothetical protein|uniref:DUF982 domain-containing protein n=1 Tax=Rhizobium sp. TaxID=391 RepID=UPI0030F0A396
MAGLDETGRLAIYWILIMSREVRSMAGEIPVFISPIDVGIEGDTGRYRHADTVEDLAAMLLSGKWTLSKAPSFHRALMTSLEALEFYADSASARTAFVAAAHETGLHVLPDDVAETRNAAEKREPHIEAGPRE